MGILVLTGCGKSKDIKPKTVFSSSFTLEYNTMQIKGNLKTEENGEIVADISKPDRLNGFQIRTDKEDIYIKFKGLETKVDENKLPNTASITLIKKLFSDILNGENIEFEETENGYTAVFDTELGEVQVQLNTDRSIKQIGLKNQGFLLKFNLKNPR